MESDIILDVIAKVHSDFPTKFGIPRQSGLVQKLKSTIVFEPKYRNRDAVRGLEEYSHLWLIWRFSQAVRQGWSPTVRPPRLGGNQRMGVFATRSPFRPNHMGLSSVRLERIEHHPKLGPVLHIAGADLMDGTPILDIKPYLAFTDSHPDAVGGFADRVRGHALRVELAKGILEDMPPQQREALVQVLEHDPRPSYQEDAQRIYGLSFAGWEVHFRVECGVLYVCHVEKVQENVSDM